MWIIQGVVAGMGRKFNLVDTAKIGTFNYKKSLYVSEKMDNTIFEGLLWKEVKHYIFKNAMLSRQQSMAFLLYLKGLNSLESSRVMRVSQNTFNTHLIRAIIKCQRVPDIGVYTVLLENFH